MVLKHEKPPLDFYVDVVHHIHFIQQAFPYSSAMMLFGCFDVKSLVVKTEKFIFTLFQSKRNMGKSISANMIQQTVNPI